MVFSCNLACPGCNRLCNRFPDATEDLSLDDVQWFIEQCAKRKQKITRLKLCGGEPTLHTQFTKVYAMLVAAAERGVFRQIIAQTNGVAKRPVVPASPFVKWKTSRPGIKRHLPYEVAPVDLGIPPARCDSLGCGPSWDARGWLPSSACIMVVRLFHLDHLYRQELPDPYKVWGESEMCRYCVFSMPKQWRREHALPLKDVKNIRPTESWARVLKEAGVKL